MKNGSFTDRRGYALSGVRHVRRHEKSFRMHCGFAALAILLDWWLE